MDNKLDGDFIDTCKKTFTGKLFKDVNHFVNADNQCLFCKHWLPTEEPIGVILLFHGCTEHSDWYGELPEVLVEVRLAVFSHDRVGHGESEGPRCDVSDYEVYVRDALQHINLLKPKYSGLPFYLFGHSLGGATALVLAAENPGLCNGVIVSSPTVMPTFIPESSFKLSLMKHFSAIFPRMRFGDAVPNAFTRNSEKVEKYVNDPLIFHGPAQLRMVYQSYRTSERVKGLFSEITYPLLILHGDKDGVCDISGSEELFRCASSEDKTFKIYEGALHEPFHEINDIPQRFLNDIKEWLRKRILE